jgi:hypothetical protein
MRLTANARLSSRVNEASLRPQFVPRLLACLRVSQAMDLSPITAPMRLWSRAEILSIPCPVPAEPGAYGWYFRKVPGQIDTSGCIMHNGMILMYVGIAPRQAPKSEAPASHQTLRSRVRYHVRGNSEGSGLRLTLGCLLAPELGIQLRRVGSRGRRTFSSGEQALSTWMAENTAVCWVETPEPWELERRLIQSVSAPLNLEYNERHSFYSVLKRLRADARLTAMQLPILPR